MPLGVRKPNAFLVGSFALPLNPSTTPEEMVGFFGEFRGTVWRIPDRRWLRLGGWKH